MTKQEIELPNQLWHDGEQWVLYTQNPKLIREIKGWNAFKDGRIRIMGTYYASLHQCMTGVYFGIQLHFRSGLVDRIAHAAGLKPPKRNATTAQIANMTRARQAKTQNGRGANIDPPNFAILGASEENPSHDKASVFHARKEACHAK